MEFVEISPENEKYVDLINPGEHAKYWVHVNAHWRERSRWAKGIQAYLILENGFPEPIGFIVVGPHYLDAGLTQPVPGVFEVIHMVIDRKYQGMGYGREATIKAMARLSDNPECQEIVIAYTPGNIRARNLYRSLGFVEFATNYEGDPLMRIPIEHKRVSGLNG